MRFSSRFQSFMFPTHFCYVANENKILKSQTSDIRIFSGGHVSVELLYILCMCLRLLRSSLRYLAMAQPTITTRMIYSTSPVSPLYMDRNII